MGRHHDSSSDSVAPPSAPADVECDLLSDVLRSVRLKGALFFLWHVSWPYTTPVPDGSRFAPIILRGAQQIISYHIVTRGSCWGGLIGQPAVPLEAGDILVIPQGNAYAISSSRERCENARTGSGELAFFERMAAHELPFVVTDGGGGDTETHLVCGFLGCDTRPFNPLLAALPKLLRLRPATPDANDRLRTLVDYALDEAREARPGSASVLLHLSELMFVEVVRRWLAEAPPMERGWLAALRDPLVGRALATLHRAPADSWTLERLATEVGVSRSRLAENFSDLVGLPPIQYLTLWRMQIAARLLADERAKVAVIGREVGYESEAAFSRAFKRSVGMSPAQWRQLSKQSSPMMPDD